MNSALTIEIENFEKNLKHATEVQEAEDKRLGDLSDNITDMCTDAKYTLDEIFGEIEEAFSKASSVLDDVYGAAQDVYLGRNFVSYESGEIESEFARLKEFMTGENK